MAESPPPLSPIPANASDDNAEDLVAALDADEFPPLTEERLTAARALLSAPGSLEKYDKITRQGMDLFFANKWDESSKLFAEHYRNDPLAANGRGTLGTIKAVLSFDPDDITAASNRLVWSCQFAQGVQPKTEGVLRSVSRWIRGGTKPDERLTTSQVRALVCAGEAELLRAIVLLIQDTLSGYIKAGLALRRGYAIYDRLRKYIFKHGLDGLADPTSPGTPVGQETMFTIDPNSLGGIHFGLGAIHIITSILPPKILTILAALGYMHDRAVGYEHLRMCLKSRTLRSPLASLLLLAFHGLLPSFATLTVPRNVPKAEAVLQETLETYPSSIIHLWLAGRVARLRHETPKAIKIFRECVGVHGPALRAALPQLEHFALYDLAWAYCAAAKWHNAMVCFRRLERESAWSKMFYAYAQGACCDALAVALALGYEIDDASQADAAPPKVEPPVDKETEKTPVVDTNAIAELKNPSGTFGLVTVEGSPGSRRQSTAERLYSSPGGDDGDSDAAILPPGLETRDFGELSAVDKIRALREHARFAYQRATGYTGIKLAGRVISVEQFVKRRLKHRMGFSRSKEQEEVCATMSPVAFDAEMARTAAIACQLTAIAEKKTQDGLALRLTTGLEIAALFNVLPQTDTTRLNLHLKTCDLFDKIGMLKADGEDVAAIQLLRATLLREIAVNTDSATPAGKKVRIENFEEAASLYNEILAMNEKSFENEKWIQPHAMYELGVLQHRSGDEEAAKATLTKNIQKRFGGKDYNFEMQMAFRLHLTGDMFRHAKDEEAEEARARAEVAAMKLVHPSWTSSSPAAASPQSGLNFASPAGASSAGLSSPGSGLHFDPQSP